MMSLNHSDQFYWLDRIGTGASRVRKVRHKFNNQVNFHATQVANMQEAACKEIIPDPTSVFDVRCIDAVARSNHPNIAQVYDRWVEQWPGIKVFVQTELCYGDLSQFIEANRVAGTHLDYRDTLTIILEIVDGLTYAHELGWSHRNLKPRNGTSTSLIRH